MTNVDPGWSLGALMATFRPHTSWLRSFAPAYAQAMESPEPATQLKGWREASMIFGDMNALVLCLFVCHHGRELVPPEARDFLGNIDLCLMDMKLATPTRAGKDIPVTDFGETEAFRRESRAARAWLDEQLRPFDGDLARAAQFAMRLTAIRLGLLHGPAEPSIEQILDGSLWQREAAA